MPTTRARRAILRSKINATEFEKMSQAKVDELHAALVKLLFDQGMGNSIEVVAGIRALIEAIVERAR